MNEITLNGSIATFNINIVGENTGQSYIGTFSCRCFLSPMQQIMSDNKYRELLGTNILYANSNITDLAFAFSQLQQRIIDYPPFWKNNPLNGSHIEDKSVIMEVLNKSIESQQKYFCEREKKQKELEESFKTRIRSGELTKEEQAKTPSTSLDVGDL